VNLRRFSVLESIGTPTLWVSLVAAVVALVLLDFLLTRRPHEVSMREAVAWSAFYVALPLAFGLYVWSRHGSQIGLEYYTGYLVEKSLSVDNLFVFILILGAFAVPRELQQRVLLYGIVGALVLRAVFIALGAAALAAFDWVFLVVAAVLATDVVFAVDSVPAVYGITEDPFLVFATNAFALLGLRALYFVLEGVLGKLRHLPHGLGVILAFIGVKLVLHWAHDVWTWIPTIPTLVSLVVVVLVLAVATVTSVVANRREAAAASLHG
jgi:tellurite resistance protein TerC